MNKSHVHEKLNAKTGIIYHHVFDVRCSKYEHLVNLSDCHLIELVKRILKDFFVWLEYLVSSLDVHCIGGNPESDLLRRRSGNTRQWKKKKSNLMISKRKLSSYQLHNLRLIISNSRSGFEKKRKKDSV